jgi:hypothetical protein
VLIKGDNFTCYGHLFANRFDAAERLLLGDPFPVAEQTALDPAGSVGALSVGANMLAYRTGGSTGNRRVEWFDRSGKLMSVSVEPTPDGKTFRAAPPVELFATRLLEISVPNRQQYAVSPDGERFLLNVPTESATVSPITVVLNWRP